MSQADIETLLRLLRGVSKEEGDTLSDERLSAAIDPFRGKGPARVTCGKKGCSRTISWWAFPVRGSRVVFQAHGPRRASVRKDEIPPEQLRSQPPAPFDEWSIAPWDGIDPSTTADETGELQRLTFTCPRCGSNYTLTMETMIELLAEALTKRRPEVGLPRGGRRPRYGL